MDLKSIGEFGFIKRISRGCLINPKNVVRAIGDDAAAFRSHEGRVTLVTTDLLLERVHFLRDAISSRDLGFKSLAVNLSDIAAMGGFAEHAFVSLAIPKSLELSYLDGFYAGMKSLANEHGVNVLGGDTTSSKTDLVINIAVVGSVPEDQMLCRNTAKVGDKIVCTGHLGDSKAGLSLILGEMDLKGEARQTLLNAHLKPKPHLAEGRFLATFEGVTAAIDVSDGLSSDLGHIAQESGLGFLLNAHAIPQSNELRDFCSQTGRDPLHLAVAGGEDYCLIACVSSHGVEDLCRAFESQFQKSLFVLGEMTRERENFLVWPDGKTKRISPEGWDHFRE